MDVDRVHFQVQSKIHASTDPRTGAVRTVLPWLAPVLETEEPESQGRGCLSTVAQAHKDPTGWQVRIEALRGFLSMILDRSAPPGPRLRGAGVARL